MAEEPTVRTYGVRICDECIALKGQMCHTPECACCRLTMTEVADFLEACQLRYVIDGEVIDLHESALIDVDEVERLRQAIRDVIDGKWSLTGLQETLGDLNRS